MAALTRDSRRTAGPGRRLVRAGLPTLALAAALAGCGAGDPPRAADGTDATACADGTCEIDVRGRAHFRPDADLDLAPVTITVADSEVTAVAKEVTEHGSSSMDIGLGGGPGSTGYLNQLQVKVVWVDGDRAVLKLSVP